MLRDLRGVPLAARAIERFQSIARRAVQSPAAARREIVVQRIADQHVGEAQSPVAAGNVAYEVRRHRLLQRFVQLVLAEVAEALQRIELEFAAEHRRKGEHVPAGRRLAPQPVPDRLLDAVGDRQRGTLPGSSIGRTGRAEKVRDLAGEQGVALGRVVHARGQLITSNACR